jgi:hypothetical protein
MTTIHAATREEAFALVCKALADVLYGEEIPLWVFQSVARSFVFGPTVLN